MKRIFPKLQLTAMNSFLFVAGQRWLAASWLDVKECIAKFCFYVFTLKGKKVMSL